jgi:hypothetical protein
MSNTFFVSWKRMIKLMPDCRCERKRGGVEIDTTGKGILTALARTSEQEDSGQRQEKSGQKGKKWLCSSAK